MIRINIGRNNGVRRCLVQSSRLASSESKPAAAPPQGIPYSKLTLGVPKEIFPNERRVAVTPAVVQALTKKGFNVAIQENAGAAAEFHNRDYEAAGGKIVDSTKAFTSDIVLKVRVPQIEEIIKFNQGGTLISFLYPVQNKPIIEEMAKRQMTAFGMDCVPRISRAQVFDALSSVSLSQLRC